jgi:hypothetical protein
MTDTSVSFMPTPPEPPRGGWWERLLQMAWPAFFATSWAPWVRIIVTAVLVFAAVVYLRG